MLNLGEEVVSYFKKNGITESTLQYANNYVCQIHETIQRVDMDRFAAVKKFLSDVAAIEHGNAAAMMASLMMKPLKFSDPDTISSVGFACIFHDLGLQDCSENVKAEVEADMTPEEIKVYREHPGKGASQLREFKTVTEAVVQAVQQHHERRTRKGFPHELGAGSINGIAEIVGICDEFVNALKRAHAKKNFDPIRHMEEHVFDGFSVNVVEAFRKAVLGKKD